MILIFFDPDFFKATSLLKATLLFQKSFSTIGKNCRKENKIFSPEFLKNFPPDFFQSYLSLESYYFLKKRFLTIGKNFWKEEKKIFSPEFFLS